MSGRIRSVPRVPSLGARQSRNKANDSAAYAALLEKSVPPDDTPLAPFFTRHPKLARVVVWSFIGFAGVTFAAWLTGCSAPKPAPEPVIAEFPCQFSISHCDLFQAEPAFDGGYMSFYLRPEHRGQSWRYVEIKIKDTPPPAWARDLVKP